MDVDRSTGGTSIGDPIFWGVHGIDL
jgi:hypothetical protein